MEKLNNIKILVLDLDNTIVNTFFNSVSEEVINSIIEVQKKGIKVILNTGRNLRDSFWISEKLKLKKYDGYIITLNGSIIYNTKTKKINILKKLNEEQKKSLLFISNKVKISIIFFSNTIEEKNFIYKRTFLIFIFSIFKKMFRFEKRTKKEILNSNISSGLIFGSIKKIKKFVDIISTKSESIFFSSGLSNTVQFSLTNKKNGLEVILKKLKINSNDVMVIGDNLNDLSLFLHFKYSIAMGNAVKEIKNKSFFITKSYLNDGASYAIKKFLL